MSSEDQQMFLVQWQRQPARIKGPLRGLRVNDQFTDVTLRAEGQELCAHKSVLAACSTYFMNEFKDARQHPTVILLFGVTFADLLALLKLMYVGEAKVSGNQLESLIKTIETIQLDVDFPYSSDADMVDAATDDVVIYVVEWFENSDNSDYISGVTRESKKFIKYQDCFYQHYWSNGEKYNWACMSHRDANKPHSKCSGRLTRTLVDDKVCISREHDLVDHPCNIILHDMCKLN